MNRILLMCAAMIVAGGASSSQTTEEWQGAGALVAELGCASPAVAEIELVPSEPSGWNKNDIWDMSIVMTSACTSSFVLELSLPWCWDEGDYVYCDGADGWWNYEASITYSTGQLEISGDDPFVGPNWTVHGVAAKTN